MLVRRFFDFIIFSSLYIAGCAVLMVHQANILFELKYPSTLYLWFVFFATVCSYNFHWYLTPDSISENERIKWTLQRKKIHLALIIVGAIGAFLFFLQLTQYWFWISISAVLTFLYSAPKLPLKFAFFLKKIAVGKTIFLALVWTYVTSILPFIIAKAEWNGEHILYSVGRFFFIYAICIIFDFRDREQDRREGIKSMVTYFNERGINRLFYLSMIVFAFSTIFLYWYGIVTMFILALLVPAVIVVLTFPYLKKNFSDYLYYFYLDGMMALPALLTTFLSF